MPREAESPIEARKAQLLRGLMEIALLRLLRDEPEYGLEILERLRRDAGLNVAEGTIYPLLHRLEKGGSIKSEWRIDPSGGRPRRYYALTPLGAEELEALSGEWRRISAALNTFLEA
ncbi:MAG: helix-turn-helix transcriptional regulator [Proteobacteria bacterium]|nr:helix-turn-helix transcriptional regulator [Pseudomonadota bacterium]